MSHPVSAPRGTLGARILPQAGDHRARRATERILRSLLTPCLFPTAHASTAPCHARSTLVGNAGLDADVPCAGTEAEPIRFR